MNKLIFKIFGLVFVLSIVMASCEKEVKLNGARVSPKEIIISEDAQPQKLYIYLYPSNTTEQDIYWASSSEAIFTISQDGVVSPVAPGIAYAVVYKGNDALDSCKVIVNPAIQAKSKVLELDTSRMFLNYSQTLTATILQEDATYLYI